MSDQQFNNFLVTHFSKWAKAELKVGFRYQFTCPDNEKGLNLYRAFLDIADSNIEIKGIELKTIKYGNIELIPVCECESFTENYIAHLRDEVSTMEGSAKGTALLIIHNSMLDTLRNSTEDVAQSGFVWHPENIRDLLRDEIDQHDEKTQISECLLNYHFDTSCTTVALLYLMYYSSTSTCTAVLHDLLYYSSTCTLLL